MRRILIIITVILFYLAERSQVFGETPWDVFADTWVATDEQGRSLPLAGECGAPRPNRTVGIFYFLWHEGQNAIHDISKLLAEDAQNPRYGPKHHFHHWGEPLFGYYQSDDEWVIRKHAQMLSDAGVDVVVFDVTNGFIYEKNYLTVCRVYESMRQAGLKTPQIAFLAHSGQERVVTQLSERFYQKDLFPGLWFRWKGKPLMMASPGGLNPGIAEFFSFRESWAWTDPGGWFGNGRDKWPWLDHTPQKYGWHEDPKQPEQIAVAVAQHPTSNIGRSHRAGKQPPADQVRPEAGIYFSEQWARALEVAPEFVFLTGWNEWTAQRFLNEGGISMMGRKLALGETFFVDQYNQEYSRDIEPMEGGHADAYYYQMAGLIRRYKGARAVPQVRSGPIRVDGRFKDWAPVQPEYRDTLGDTAHRQHAGWKGEPPFENRTGRNDIAAAKTSMDGKNVYFYVRCQSAISEASTNWMMLFLDTDRNARTGWQGFDLVVNRSRPGKRPMVENHAGNGYRWTSAGRANLRWQGGELELSFSKSALGPGAEQGFDFKWCDNIQQTGEATDFTLHGDSAPNDRFKYRAVFPTQ